MRKKGIALACAAVLLMTGCGAGLPEMTDEESNLIGEYAAITLLKYDANSRSRLVDWSQLEEKEEAEVPSGSEPSAPEESQPQELPDVSDTPVIDNREKDNYGTDSIESFLDFPAGVSVVYMGYELCQSYPEEDSQYFVLEASEGKELLVLCFSLQNNSGTTQDFKLMERRDSYRVTLNGDYARTALTTMLTNDLATYMDTVPAGETKEVVLLFEIEPEQAGTVETVSLRLKNDLKTCTIQLQ